MKSNKRLLILAFFAIGVSFSFWIFSRYPALNDKASMMREAPTYDVLTLGPLMKYSLSDGVAKKVMATTLNWYNSNWRGMLYGLVLASLFLAISQVWTFKKSKRSSFDQIKGLLIGVPLGLCVNCAAPVATTLYHSTGSAPLALSALLSSPTLNFVVVGMVISMFPLEIAAPKIFFTLLIVGGAVPLLSRGLNKEMAESDCARDTLEMSSEKWSEALIGSFHLFAISFFKVLIRTLPLMLLTGFLAAVLIHTLPLEIILRRAEFNLTTALGAAVLGTLLPLPVAVDVLIAQTIFMAGFSPALVSIFLFTLGSYSLYPLMLIGKEVSKKTSILIFMIIALTGIASGYSTNYLRPFFMRKNQEIANASFQGDPVGQAEKRSKHFYGAVSSKGPEYLHYYTEGALSLFSLPLKKSTKSEVFLGFEKKEASAIGIAPDVALKDEEIIEPVSYGRGLASGDINRDGFMDVVYATARGPAIYLNNHDGTFKEAKVSPELQKYDLLSVALVDLDNDGWCDLYMSTMKDGPLIAKNDKGSFLNVPADQLIHLPHPKESITVSSAFADVTHSGRLDIFQGNWYFGNFPTAPAEPAADFILQNKGSAYEAHLVGNELSGPTLTSLFFDKDNDGYLDLYVGNDFDYPDQVFLNNKKGEFFLQKKKDLPFLNVPRLSMSIDSGDMNNDGVLDFYMSGVSEKRSIFLKEGCAHLSRREDIDRCYELARHYKLDLNAKSAAQVQNDCKSITNGKGERACLAIGLSFLSINLNEPSLCRAVPSEFDLARSTCQRYHARLKGPHLLGTHDRFFRSFVYGPEDDLVQKKAGNVLLVSTLKGFKDNSKESSTEEAGWSWNAKFADLDNDEWQDLYVANGFLDFEDQTTDKFFFRNLHNGQFEAQQEQFNLSEVLPFSAYTYLDIDNDGYLDILTNSTLGRPLAFLNKGGPGRSLQIELEDQRGNRDCIGCKVIIHYGKMNERQQIREVKAGGGFLSFDAPLLSFGLGGFEQVNSVEVFWSTGEKSLIKKGLVADNRYKIQRGPL